MLDTSLSLLERLRDGKEAGGWSRLVDLYSPLIERWARRYGLQPHDVDDVVQDVLVELHRELPRFQYDRSQGLFRSWLRTVTVNRLRVFWRQKKPIPIGGGDSNIPNQLDELADPHSGVSKLWDQEHDAHVAQRCMKSIEQEFEPQTWQAFALVVIQGLKPDEAAARLGMTRGAVYTAKFRVLARLKQEAAGLVGPE
jgi:RNA polymerase sigma-70 factor (ECF subfamily)